MALGITAYSEAPFGSAESNVIAYPLGIELTAQENTPSTTGDANVSVTGLGMTGTLGDTIGSAFVLVQPTGVGFTANLGTVSEVPIGQQVDVTGFELTANGNNPTNDTLTAFGEAPFAALSPATFNIPVGIEATVGAVLVGTELPMSLGSVAVTADANTGTLTGQAMTMQEGQAY